VVVATTATRVFWIYVHAFCLFAKIMGKLIGVDDLERSKQMEE